MTLAELARATLSHTHEGYGRERSSPLARLRLSMGKTTNLTQASRLATLSSLTSYTVLLNVTCDHHQRQHTYLPASHVLMNHLRHTGRKPIITVESIQCTPASF